MAFLKKALDYKKSLLVVVTALVILISGVLYFNIKSKPELKAKEFESAVNENVSKKADTYLSNSKKDTIVEFEKSDINIKKLGTYKVKFKYEGELYSVTIKIVDKEKPIIKADQKIFVFDMETSVKEVNKEINKHIKISDNYDKVFNDINVIDKLPSDEKEVLCKLKVKDTSGNESEPFEIKVQFTKDGKEKKGLKQETKIIETAISKNEKSITGGETDKKSKNESETTSTKNNDEKSDKPSDKNDSNKGSSSNTSNGNSNGSNSNNSDTGNNNENTNAPTEKPNKPVEPSEPPRPSEQPKPDKPIQKPQLTVANCPDYWKGPNTTLFATYDEAYNWWNAQVTTEGSPHFNGGGDISPIEDNDFIGVIYAVNFY